MQVNPQAHAAQAPLINRPEQSCTLTRVCRYGTGTLIALTLASTALTIYKSCSFNESDDCAKNTAGNALFTVALAGVAGIFCVCTNAVKKVSKVVDSYLRVVHEQPNSETVRLTNSLQRAIGEVATQHIQDEKDNVV